MATIIGPAPLAAVGSTSNNSHNGINAHPGADSVCLEFIVEAIGATPTVTYKLQGTFKDAPAATDWHDLAMISAEADTVITTKAVTTVGRFYSYLSQAQSRFLKSVRLVTTLNTNVTYSANLHQQLKP